MKTRIATLAMLASLLASGSAMAQTAASGTVNITATVAASCTINTSTSAGTLATADFSNSGSSLISTAAYTNASLATGDCNTPTHVTVTSLNGAAILSGATSASTSGGYANNFDYTAVVTFSNATATLSTGTTPGFVAAAGTETVTSNATSGPANGSVGITITPNGTPKIQVGSYSDVLTVTLTAN